MFRRAAIIISLAFAQAVIARDPAATMPTTRPATTAPSAAELLTQIRDLGDRDPAVRAEARDVLMQLSRDDLPMLADAARSLSTLQPAQRSLLHEIATQVYLTGQHNFTGVGAGYIGVTLGQVYADGDVAHGAEVAGRWPGYDSVRAFQPGDLIVGVGKPGGIATVFRPVEDTQTLRAVVGPTVPGEWIAFQVVRQGVTCETLVRIAPIPPAEAFIIGGGSQQTISTDWIDQQNALGEEYWRKTFLPRMRPAPTTHPAHRR